MLIKKAVFPIAGLGTRFLPATKACPKEMLPVVDKPLIQYAVEEAYNAGIRQMIFVTGRHKRAVEDHFDVSFELEMELEALEKHDLLSLIRSTKPHDMDCVYIRQSRALGLGHAVLCAQKLIGNEPFAVLLADDLMVSQTPVLAQMIRQFNTYRSSIVAVEEVPHAHTERYGILSGNAITDQIIEVTHIIEKPRPHLAPSNLGIVGRYILTPGIFKELAQHKIGLNNEIQLTDSIASLTQHERILAYRFIGKRYDCGCKLGFLQATVDLASQDHDISPEFVAWLTIRNTK